MKGFSMQTVSTRFAGFRRCLLVVLRVAVALVALPATALAERTTVYYYTDPQGSILAVTDASGNIIERRDYKPYGAPVSMPSDGPGYTGHVSDPDTALTYMQQRYYDPEVGRFLSTDPVGMSFGGMQHFNRYDYAYSNPYRYTDPDGRCPTCFVGFLIGAGIEAGVQIYQNGKVNNWTAVAISGAAGAVTSGVSAFAGRAAVSGAITASRSVATTALSGAASNAVGKVVEGEINGRPASSKEVAIAAAAGFAGAGTGARIGNAVTSRLESMAVSSGLSGTIGRTTQVVVQDGGKVSGASTSTFEKVAQIEADVLSNYAEKKANP